jgi:hypothetical protein
MSQSKDIKDVLNLAHYYFDNHNYKLAEKYYKEAANLGNNIARQKLQIIYNIKQKQEQEQELINFIFNLIVFIIIFLILYCLYLQYKIYIMDIYGIINRLKTIYLKMGVYKICLFN